MNAPSARLPAASRPRCRCRSHASSRSPSRSCPQGGMSPRDAGRRVRAHQTAPVGQKSSARSWLRWRIASGKRGSSEPSGARRVAHQGLCQPYRATEICASAGRSMNWRWLATTSSAVRSGQFGISWQTSRYASPATSRRSTTSIVARETGVMSSASAGSRRNGTSAPRARATAAISASSVDTTTRAKRPLRSAASTE